MPEQTARQTANTSIEPSQRIPLQEYTWETIQDPGAYVEVGTGEAHAAHPDPADPESGLAQSSVLHALLPSWSAVHPAPVQPNPWIGWEALR